MNKRILSVDVLRGITIAGMILVNNPGGGDENAYAPLQHAEWIGLTPTDLVFPFFMFIMGISTFLSLQKYKEKKVSSGTNVYIKIIRRALLLWLTGLSVAWIILFTRHQLDSSVSCSLHDLRLLGVLPRLGICYGLAALIGMTVRRRYIPWIAVVLYAGYFVLLETCNGYVHDSTNILARVDDLILGHNHVYRWDSPDPEGILSTIPALAHVLVGYLAGSMIMQKTKLDQKIESLFLLGTALTLGAFLLQYACPFSKKLWTPTFSLMTCGMASLLLALLTFIIDKKQKHNGAITFFQVFGINPLALYTLSALLLIPFSILPLAEGTTVQRYVYEHLCTVMSNEAASLVWAIVYILINWSIGYWLYKKKIYIKL